MCKLKEIVKNHKFTTALILIVIMAVMIMISFKFYTVVTTQRIELSYNSRVATIRVPKNWNIKKDSNGFLQFFDSNGILVMEEVYGCDEFGNVVYNPSQLFLNSDVDTVVLGATTSLSSVWRVNIYEKVETKIAVVNITYYSINYSFNWYVYDEKEINKILNWWWFNPARKIADSVRWNVE